MLHHPTDGGFGSCLSEALRQQVRLQERFRQCGRQIAPEQSRCKCSGLGAGESSKHTACDSGQSTDEELPSLESDGRSRERAHNHTNSELWRHKAAGGFGQLVSYDFPNGNKLAAMVTNFDAVIRVPLDLV
jgi:hypothetical protein